MLDSDYRPLCAVILPFAGRQRYMHSFDLADPKMAEGFEDYLEPVVALIGAAGARRGVAHMTVDEKLVEAGRSQRRPHPHVDGRYEPGLNGWTHRGWYHDKPKPKPQEPDEAPAPKPGMRHRSESEVRRMPVIVAASVAGCRAWRGRFEGEPASDGDLSHIAGQLGEGEVLPAGVGYLLSPDCVHESMTFERPVRRSFLRIALPLDYRFAA